MNLRGLMKKETVRRLQVIEKLYYTEEDVASEELIELLGCSHPVLLNDISYLNGKNLPFRINKNKGRYSIDFEDTATMDGIYSYVIRENLEYQIIDYLFFEEKEKIQNAARRLNCSFSNMQRYLVVIKSTLAAWDMEIPHRPLRVEGDELTIRHFYYLFFKESRTPFSNYKFSNSLVSAIDQLIRQILADNEITNNMTVHFQLMHSFLIGLQRLKCDHLVDSLSSECGLVIPEIDDLYRIVRLVRQELGIVFTEAELKQCLWPLFSHHLILNRRQQSIVHRENRRLAKFYETHHFLLERINDLLVTPLSQPEMAETMRLLGNELFRYYPNKWSIEILQEPDRSLLNLIDKKYSRELKKLEKIVSEFLIYQQHEAFIPLYISCLVTRIDNIFQRLVESDKPISVLLLSDTSATHERFWQSIFPAYLKGAVKYDYFETPFIHQDQLTYLTQEYDLIITDVTMTGLVSVCPLIAINSYPTAKDFDRIQQFINHFEPFPLRKELYNELTPST